MTRGLSPAPPQAFDTKVNEGHTIQFTYRTHTLELTCNDGSKNGVWKKEFVLWFWFLSELSIGALKGMNVSSGHVSVTQMKGEMSLCVLGGLVEQTEKTETVDLHVCKLFHQLFSLSLFLLAI